MDLCLHCPQRLLAIFPAEVTFQQIQIALKHCQGASQVMRGIGKEVPLRFETSIEVLNHVVEGSGKLSDLIHWAIVAHPLTEV